MVQAAATTTTWNLLSGLHLKLAAMIPVRVALVKKQRNAASVRASVWGYRGRR